MYHILFEIKLRPYGSVPK